jgi:hypothetical protein
LQVEIQFSQHHSFMGDTLCLFAILIKNELTICLHLFLCSQFYSTDLWVCSYARESWFCLLVSSLFLSLAKDLFCLFVCFKKATLRYIDFFSYSFSIVCLICLYPELYYFLPSANLGFSLSTSLRHNVKLFIWDLSFF